MIFCSCVCVGGGGEGALFKMKHKGQLYTVKNSFIQLMGWVKKFGVGGWRRRRETGDTKL